MSGAAGAEAALSRLITDPESRRDPYPIYHEMRRCAPVFLSSFGTWILTRFEDCYAILRDPRCGKDWNGFMMQSGLTDWREHVSLAYGDRSLLFANPPQHTRLRRLVAKAFTPRMVERLRPRMDAVIDALLSPIEQAGGGDILDALAFPLPVTVIGELLGVPEQDRGEFRERVRVNTRTLEIGVTPEQIAEADAATMWMGDYFRALLADKRARRSDDMLTAMLEVEEAGERLSDDEIVSMGLLLFAAGFETTTNLIGNGVYNLLVHRDQLELLRADRSLLPNAVEELLRFDGSIQFSERTAMIDIELAGHAIAAGTNLMTLLGAGNRDPERYPDPDRLDVGRQGVEPLTFGSGIHYCLGASLARSEAQMAIGKLLDRFATVELDETPRFRDQLGFRGLESLRVSTM
ncbi:MAG TPA: cytochrome P450 [Candidatus Binatia bacterium]|nr:cytochrome P450 [Candidatus Binatia bacterium]